MNQIIEIERPHLQQNPVDAAVRFHELLAEPLLDSQRRLYHQKPKFFWQKPAAKPEPVDELVLHPVRWTGHLFADLHHRICHWTQMNERRRSTCFTRIVNIR